MSSSTSDTDWTSLAQQACGDAEGALAEDASKLEEYKSLVAKLTGAHVTELISYLHGFDDSKFRTEANDLMADTTDETRRTVEAALFHTAKASLIKLMTRLSAGGKGEEGSGSGPEQDPPSVSVSSKDGGG